MTKRRSLWENALGVLIAAMVFVLAGAAHDRGIVQKWVTALFGTLFSFCFVIYLRRRYLRWSFWLALAICLLVHCMVVAAIFKYAFADFPRMSPLLWLPFMLFEVVFLLIVIKRIEEKITGRRETIKLSF